MKCGAGLQSLSTESRLNIVPLLQAVYQLDMSSLAQTRLKDTPSHIGKISFSYSCELIVITEYHSAAQEPGLQNFVYDRNGCEIVRFRDLDSCAAYVVRNRLAVAHKSFFNIWDLMSGQKHGTLEPVARENTDSHHQGRIAANGSGTQLAFCPVAAEILHLYDALTLAPLCRLHPAGCNPPRASGSSLCALGWGASHGWWMGYGSNSPHGSRMDQPWTVLVVQPQADSTYKEVLRCERQFGLFPTLSPDGAFMCSFEPLGASINVHDTHSGQLMLAQSLCHPDGVQAPEPLQGAREVNAFNLEYMQWSACGRKLCIAATWGNGAFVTEDTVAAQIMEVLF